MLGIKYLVFINPLFYSSSYNVYIIFKLKLASIKAYRKTGKNSRKLKLLGAATYFQLLHYVNAQVQIVRCSLVRYPYGEYFLDPPILHYFFIVS